MDKARGWLVAVVMLAGLGSGVAQERDPPSPYFACPYVNYFGSGCPQLEPDTAQAAPPVESQPETPEVVEEQEDAYEWTDHAPETLLPLFPKESLAPDTPELYRMLLVKPTLENARRYVRWYSRRMRRIQEAQALIEIAGQEFLAERAAAE